MAVLKKFCCCCGIMNGSIYCGVYSLLGRDMVILVSLMISFYLQFTSSVFIGLLIIRYSEFKSVDTSPAYSVTLFTTVTLYALLLISSIILLVGISKNKVLMLLPWIVMTVACNIAGTAVLCWFLVRYMSFWRDVPTWEAGIMAYHLCNSLMLIYCLLCVISHLQALISGKDSLDGRRRRQRRHRDVGHHFPFDPAWPWSSQVIDPPPYREKPPEYQWTDDQDGDRVHRYIHDDKIGRYCPSVSETIALSLTTTDLSVHGQSRNLSEDEQHSVHAIANPKAGMNQCKPLTTVLAPSSFTMGGIPFTRNQKKNQLKRLPRHPSPIMSRSNREQVHVANNERQVPNPYNEADVRENIKRDRPPRYLVN